jgi:hypothetical protein
MECSKRSWMALGLGALGLLGCGGADGGLAEQESETTENSAPLAARKFLSLGDSIPFGFNPLVTTPHLPSGYIGYPEVMASSGNKVTNASCPGETSGSFLSALERDNGCRAFKSNFSLHADYETTQVAYTVATMKKTKFDFVTLNIGANDLFLLQKDCLGVVSCIQAGLPAVVAAYAQNLMTGYNQVKPEGNKEKFIGVTTYALNYNDPLSVGALTQINNAMKSFTTQIGGTLADGFAAFQAATAAFGGDSCAAGLLIQKPDGTCDIHPSQAGRELLATTVLEVAQ